MTSFGPVTDVQALLTTTDLANRSFAHAISPVKAPVELSFTEQDPFAYITTDRYTDKEFYGIMIDTGASRRSTAGLGQYKAYKRIVKDANIDTTQAGAINVQFGIGSTPSIGSITINTPIGNVDFHVVQADTPFLLCLADMDSLRTYYNNVTDTLITPSAKLPITRRFGHPFLLWKDALQAYIQQSFNYNPCFLTDTEIRRLHRRFGHPSAEKLYKLLERSGHDIDRQVLDQLTKFCSFC